MKILRVINSLGIGGAERSIVGNVPLHIDNGFEMEVLLLNGEETFFYKELKSKGIKIHSLGVNTKFYNPLIIFKLMKFMRKYDIIHVHLFPSLYWVAMAKMLTFSKTKLVYTEHATTNRRRESCILSFIDKMIYKQYATIIAISPATKDELIAHIQSEDKIVIINNGVDINRIKNDSKEVPNDFMDLIKNKKVLMQVAGFRHEKDQDTVIKALTQLPEEYCAVFVGEGERKKVCEQLANELGVANRAYFIGLKENASSYLSHADIVVMSSHIEGFGRAAVEGMALGKPILASNVKGLSEVVDNNELLFEVGDYKTLAKKTILLTTNDEYYRKTGISCVQKAEQFDIKYMVDGYEAIYHSLV